jgi:hypothetical protein
MLLITTFVELCLVDGRNRTRAGRPQGRIWTADTNSHTPCHAHAALCRSLEKSLSERYCRCIARARHGMCESITAILCKSNGKDKLKSQRHGTVRHGTARQGNGMGAAWKQYGMCELAFTMRDICHLSSHTTTKITSPAPVTWSHISTRKWLATTGLFDNVR